VVTRRRWLRRAGFIVGLAGVAVLIVWVLFNYEGGPSRFAMPALVIYVTPLLVCVLIAWKWPLVGGIILVTISLFCLIYIIIIPFSTPITQSIPPLLLSRFRLAAPVTLPPLASGILFILYWRAERAYLTRKKGCELR
jgi:hypothetical protein